MDRGADPRCANGVGRKDGRRSRAAIESDSYRQLPYPRAGSKAAVRAVNPDQQLWLGAGRPPLGAARGHPGPALRTPRPGPPDTSGCWNHIAVCVEGGALAESADFCTRAFGLPRRSSEYVQIGEHGLDSTVVRSPSGEITKFDVAGAGTGAGGTTCKATSGFSGIAGPRWSGLRSYHTIT